MEKTFVQANTASELAVEVDGIRYEFKIENYENIDGYAPIIIHDTYNDERYNSYGYLELNNHIFISRWKREYADYRDNWICSKDLIIEIQ